MNTLRLIAASDDYLLEEALKEAIAELEEALGVTAEVFAEDVTPETIALELSSPSLFASERILVVENARSWLDTSTPVGAPKAAKKVDLGPLLVTIEDGVSEGMALCLGAWCGGKPKGKLVDLLKKKGDASWIPSPPPPKPWETVTLSGEQSAVLERVLRRSAGSATFTRGSARLLMERLGFAPRQLAREVEKLAAAAGAGQQVSEDLVRSLTFPAERSLEVIQKAILAANISPIVDLIAAASAGTPIRDWQGRHLDGPAVATVVFGQIASLLAQMLDLRQTTYHLGLEAELDPQRTTARGWYTRHFKTGLGPRLVEGLDRDSPLFRNGRAPGVWQLSQVFEGAARYSDDHLRASLAAAGDVEARLRGPMALDALAAWAARVTPRPTSRR